MEHPIILSKSEQTHLLLCLNVGNSPKRVVIVRVFLECGLRLSELVALNIENLRFGQYPGKLVLSADEGWRELPLSIPTRVSFNRWLMERSARTEGFLNADAPLFTGRKGSRITPSGVDSIVRAAGLLSGLSLSARTLRSTYLHNLANSGVDILTMSIQGGFRSLNSTMRYRLE